MSVITPWLLQNRANTFKGLEVGHARTEKVETERSEQMGLWVPAVRKSLQASEQGCAKACLKRVILAGV